MAEDLQTRLLRHVDMTEDGHWLWNTALRKDGYAQIRVGSKKLYAHRVSYTLFVGPIPENSELDHLCRIRHCINPNHLEPVSKYENMMRGNAGAAVNKRKTRCVKGHEFAGDNLYVTAQGARVCVECRRVRYKKWYDEHERKGD